VLAHKLRQHFIFAQEFCLQLFKLLLLDRNSGAGPLPFKGGCSVLEKAFLPGVQEREMNLMLLPQLQDGHFVYECSRRILTFSSLENFRLGFSILRVLSLGPDYVTQIASFSNSNRSSTHTTNAYLYCSE